MSRTLEYPKYLEPIARSKSSTVEVFKDFVRMSVCALSAWTREQDYLDVAGRYNRHELGEISKALGSLTMQMEEHPFEDLLGEYYQDIASKATRDGRGEFYTPPCISEFMARIAINAEQIISRGRAFTVNEPTVGSGGMILQIAKQLAPKEKWAPSYVDLMRVTASDISPTACDMSLVNFTMWGIPAEVMHQNSLSMEAWWHWKTIHWHRVGEDTRRQLNALSAFISNPSNKEEPKKESARTTADAEYNLPRRENGDGQFEMNF